MRTEKTITRTVKNWKVNALVADTNAMEFVTMDFPVPELVGIDKHEDYINKKLCPAGVRVIRINSAEKQEQLYAMSETEFLMYAHKIDKR